MVGFMAELTPQLLDAIVAACRKGASEAAEAFSRALDGKFSLEVGQPQPAGAPGLTAELASPGLAIVLTVGSSGALVLVPESGGILPTWYGSPDPTGTSKLSTLAQELGMLLLPEDAMPDDFKSGRVRTMAGAVARGGVDPTGYCIPLELRGDGRQATARLFFPLGQPGMVLGASEKAAATPSSAPAGAPRGSTTGQAKAPRAGSSAATPAARPAARGVSPRSPQALPPYSKSLLRIRVPVVVTLAHKRQPFGRIVEWGPGSIIQFDKSCEEMLELSVGGLPVALGEAVKVGDKFGLRVMSIIPPGERFKPVQPS